MNLAALLLPLVALLQPAQTAPTSAPASKLRAELYADHEAIQPGGQMELAVKLIIEPGWHIYHPITLGVGLPTTIDFQLPAGATVGELRFPTPTLVDEAGVEYLSLEDQPVVLTTLKLAADAPATPLKIVARVHGEVCKQVCMRAEARATLTLNVSAAPPPAANAKLFEEAKAALPKPLAQAPNLEDSRLLVSHTKVPVGGKAILVAVIGVPAGHHTQDRDPGVEGLIPTRLFIESRDGIEFDGDHELWPKPRIEESPGVGKARVQSGKFVVGVPFVIDDKKFKPGPVRLGVLLQYQVCKDRGTCFQPELAEGFVQFEVVAADQPEVKNHDPILAKVGMAQPTTQATTPAGGLGGSAEGGGAALAGAAPAGAIDWARVLYMVVLGYLGGMILNITPCVFPVISIKILGFVNQAGEDRRRVLRLGLVFCAGIMIWFWLFGILTGLGQVPLQYPPVTIGLAAILFVLALSLFGVYEIMLPGAATGTLGEAASREGYAGALMNGFLATLLGTACTGPFFAGAAAYAATQPRAISMIIFTSAGLGMSTPYLLLAAFPGWLKRLPRPGPWMITFKQVMGFVILGTVVFLLHVIGKQLDVDGLVRVIAFLGFLSVSAWIIGRIRLNWDTGKRLTSWVVALAISGFGLWFCLFNRYDIRHPDQSSSDAPAAIQSGPVDAQTVDAVVARVAKADWTNAIPWQPFQPGLAEELSRRGYTVYVDYTADWCINCKTNLYTAVETESTRTRMQKLGVIPIVGDYTKPNAAIRAELLRFQHNSVPLNLVYPPGKPHGAIVLPVLFTPAIILNALDEAGPSQPRSQFGPPDP